MKSTAIVTGASRGIGRAVAKRLAHDGFAVVVNYLTNSADAENVVAEIKRTGGDAISIKADIASQNDVERLFEETMKKFGSIDVVVNNSGIMPLSPIGKSEVELFDKVISTNLRGTFLVLAQAVQHIAHSGRIIAFSSDVLADPTVHVSRQRRASKAWCTCSLTNCEVAMLPSTPSLPDLWQPIFS
jgi:3-oxoacyl-[acyl-carrier protein] reductase